MVVISDEIVYASVLISSIVVGLYVKTIQTRWSKQVNSTMMYYRQHLLCAVILLLIISTLTGNIH